MPNKIQVFYESLAHGSKCLLEQAHQTARLNHYLCQTLEQLQSGGWRGAGAEAFFAEMHDLVLPAVGRLYHALNDSSDVLKRISTIFREAEEEARRLFEGMGFGTVDPSGTADSNPGDFAINNTVPLEGNPPPICAVGDSACQTEALEQMGIDFDPQQWTPEQIEMLYWARMFSQDYFLDVPGNIAPPNPDDPLENPCASLIGSIFSQTGIFSSRLDVTGVALLFGILTGQQYGDKLTRTFDHTANIGHNNEYSFSTTGGCGGNCIDGPVPENVATAGETQILKWQAIQPGSIVVHYDGAGDLEFGRYPHVTMVAGWSSQSPTGEVTLYPDYQAALDAGITDPVPYVMDRGIGGPDDPWRGPRPFNDIYNEGVEMGYLSTTSYVIFNMEPETAQP